MYERAHGDALLFFYGNGGGCFYFWFRGLTAGQEVRYPVFIFVSFFFLGHGGERIGVVSSCFILASLAFERLFLCLVKKKKTEEELGGKMTRLGGAG